MRPAGLPPEYGAAEASEYIAGLFDDGLTFGAHDVAQEILCKRVKLSLIYYIKGTGRPCRSRF